MNERTREQEKRYTAVGDNFICVCSLICIVLYMSFCIFIFLMSEKTFLWNVLDEIENDKNQGWRHGTRTITST